MVTRIFAILLVATSAFGQAFSYEDMAWAKEIATPAVVSGDSFHPTNIVGKPAYTWYFPQGHYLSTSGSAILTNLASGGEAINMTNLTTGTSYHPTYTENALDSTAALSFDGNGDYLYSVNYTSPQPHEVYMLCKFDMPSAATRYLFGNGASPRNAIRFDSTTNTVAVIGGTTVNGTQPPVDTWLVLGYSFKTGSGGIVGWTNNVQEFTGTATGAASSTYIAGNEASSSLKLTLIEWFSYQTNLTDLERWNIYNRWRTNFPSASLPEQAAP